MLARENSVDLSNGRTIFLFDYEVNGFNLGRKDRLNLSEPSHWTKKDCAQSDVCNTADRTRGLRLE